MTGAYRSEVDAPSDAAQGRTTPAPDAPAPATISTGPDPADSAGTSEGRARRGRRRRRRPSDPPDLVDIADATGVVPVATGAAIGSGATTESESGAGGTTPAPSGDTEQSRPPAIPTQAAPGPPDPDEDGYAEDDDLVSSVRPYSWTRGRTVSTTDLQLETLVSTTEHGRDMASLTSIEHRAVAELCSTPRSVAEVAAMLHLPIGVARVVLGDMAGMELVAVHDGTSGDAPDTALMERVLSGLRRL